MACRIYEYRILSFEINFARKGAGIWAFFVVLVTALKILHFVVAMAKKTCRSLAITTCSRGSFYIDNTVHQTCCAWVTNGFGMATPIETVVQNLKGMSPSMVLRPSSEIHCRKFWTRSSSRSQSCDELLFQNIGYFSSLHHLKLYKRKKKKKGKKRNYEKKKKNQLIISRYRCNVRSN